MSENDKLSFSGSNALRSPRSSRPGRHYIDFPAVLLSLVVSFLYLFSPLRTKGKKRAERERLHRRADVSRVRAAALSPQEVSPFIYSQSRRYKESIVGEGCSLTLCSGPSASFSTPEFREKVGPQAASYRELISIPSGHHCV